ncbi:acyl carrier protein [Panacibacter ginsenosidivorans]|uniref:Acyl carrier protein n=1 Tax=Panacibacter ginsenosidivorans TaxID=1813871 RepID=A0A5B8V600_9BACT|nr:acyl carrier protein [Panacibacter ginsenosidivorans]QEC66263.1 acyl carrier protein [Panacibacter ginsenosidivorans]
MNEQEIRQTIFQLLKKIAPDTEPEKLQPDDDIRHTLEIDSFDGLQFVVALDEHFGIETPEADYGKIDTLRNLVTYIMQRKK